MTTEKHFLIKEAFKEGWQITKSHFGFLALVLITFLVVQGIPLAIADYYNMHESLWGIVFYVIYLAASLTMGLGAIQIMLRLVDRKEATLKDLFSCFPYIGRYFFGQILYLLILLGGLILLVFPMFIWGLRYAYFPYFIVDKHVRPIQALKDSGALTYGAKWKLLGFFILAGLLNFLGALSIVGIFVTWPWTLSAQATIFRTLQEQSKVIPPSA